MPWAIKHIIHNKLDGYREYFEGAALVAKPIEMAGYKTKVFATREAARAYIRENCGLYRRPDLRAEPYGWRMPRATRVSVTIIES